MVLVEAMSESSVVYWGRLRAGNPATSCELNGWSIPVAQEVNQGITSRVVLSSIKGLVSVSPTSGNARGKKKLPTFPTARVFASDELLRVGFVLLRTMLALVYKGVSDGNFHT